MVQRKVKGKGKPKVAPAPAPLAYKKPIERKVVNPLFYARPRDFKSWSDRDIQPKRDLYRFVKWPRYIRLQRQRAILYQRLRVPPAVHQFKQTLDRHQALELFRLLDKYRPESKKAKKERLFKRAVEKVAGRDDVSKKPQRQLCVSSGIKKVTTLVEQKKARLVAIASDVDPIEIVLFLPALCSRMGIPYCIVRNKSRLGRVVRRKTVSSLCLTEVNANDRTSLNKLIEVLKVNYNDRQFEIRRNRGGRILSGKTQAKMAKAKERKERERRV